MKLIKNICRLLVGIVFIYSGFVKGVDPLGSNYKFIDYFYAFHMDWLEGSALAFSFLLSLTEFMIGICLMLNIQIKWGIWGALVFMGAFTPLSLILAIKNPVTDCGCFGDALLLTHWETFWKNTILLILTLVIFHYKKTFKSTFYFYEQILIFICSSLFILSVECYCYRHLPILDFRPYAIGQNIQENMRIPAGAPQDEYAITLKYQNRKTKEIKEFNEQDYPWQDTANWTFVSTSEKLIQKGYEAPIRDFFIEHPVRGNITQEILEDSGYTFLVVAYNILQTNSKHQDKLNRLAAYATEKGYRFYGLSASDKEDIQKFADAHHVCYDFCTTDEIQLKTMIRSNPGLLLIREGTIINKWGHRDIPEVDELNHQDLTAYSLKIQQHASNRRMIWIFILGYTSILSLYLIRKYKKNR